jgi:diaminopimelate epimerase
VIRPRIEPSGLVTVDMGRPEFEPREIPFEANDRRLTYPIEIEGRLIELGVLSMGNPHAVQVVRDIDAAPVTTQGPLIEHHPRFPRRVNAGYMQVIGRDFIRLRWERGAAEHSRRTPARRRHRRAAACSTRTCACSLAAASSQSAGPGRTLRYDDGRRRPVLRRDRPVTKTPTCLPRRGRLPRRVASSSA